MTTFERKTIVNRKEANQDVLGYVEFEEYDKRALGYVQENYSIDEVFDEDDIVDYVRDNYNIYDVFDDKEIVDYAKENCGIDELIDEYDILDYIKETYSVENFVEWR